MLRHVIGPDLTPREIPACSHKEAAAAIHPTLNFYYNEPVAATEKSLAFKSPHFCLAGFNFFAAVLRRAGHHAIN